VSRVVALLLGLLFAGAALATSPTLTGNGYTSVNASVGVVVLNIGSPVAGTLVELPLACNDISASDTLALTAPGGWTKEIEHTGANSTQGVLWKIASGSEGATLSVTVGTSTSECASWYFKFTGYDTTNPLDCTDIAWAFSSTLDPPSQSVAGGPLDVYANAFATSRGDEDYNSGSDLTTNDHQDAITSSGAIGIASGRSVAVSYGAYSAIPSKNPGAFVLGSAVRFGAAVTCVTYPAVAAGGANPLDGPLRPLRVVR
jgi:hypothetical protein